MFTVQFSSDVKTMSQTKIDATHSTITIKDLNDESQIDSNYSQLNDHKGS